MKKDSNRRIPNYLTRVQRELSPTSNQLREEISNLITQSPTGLPQVIAIFILLKKEEQHWIKTTIRPSSTTENLPPKLIKRAQRLARHKSIVSFKTQQPTLQNIVNYYINTLRRFIIEADEVIHFYHAEQLATKYNLATTRQALQGLALTLEVYNDLTLQCMQPNSNEVIRKYQTYRLLTHEQVLAATSAWQLNEQRQACSFKSFKENQKRKALFAEMKTELEKAELTDAEIYIQRFSRGRGIHCCKIKGNTCMRCPYNVGFSYNKTKLATASA